jgi:hypothetical protein
MPALCRYQQVSNRNSIKQQGGRGRVVGWDCWKGVMSGRGRENMVVQVQDRERVDSRGAGMGRLEGPCTLQLTCTYSCLPW